MTDSAKKMPITEEQAKILLEQSKMETERNMRGSGDRGKKWLILGAVLVIAAIAIALVSHTMMDGLSK